MHATCPTHLTLLNFIIIYFMKPINSIRRENLFNYLTKPKNFHHLPIDSTLKQTLTHSISLECNEQNNYHAMKTM